MQTKFLTAIFILAALVATACTPSAPANTAAPAEAATPAEATTDTTAEETPPLAEPVEAEPVEAEPVEAEPVEETAPVAEPAEAEPVTAMTKLNLNTVTGDELLATIPDFGGRMVREFQEYSPYISIQQFRREIGKYVDDAQVAFYEEYVYVPINVNDSDAETLLQIPDLDAAAADALMAARPFDNNDAFLQKLSEVAPAVDAAVAQGYLEAQ